MRERQPNRLLAWERLQRGWSYEEVTERIRAEMARCGESDTGLTANTVRRWETGERHPDPRYRKHLVSIMGKPASELGLLTAEELSMRPEAAAADDVRRLLDVIGGVPRSAVLRGLLRAGALPLLAPLLSLDGDESSSHPRPALDPDTYMMITQCHRRLYWTSPARALYEAAYAHAQLGVEMLRGTSGSARTTLAPALAESALLTARLALFDLHSPAVAERCFDVALSATREAGDHALAAGVLGHMAFSSIFGPNPSQARGLIDAALQHSWHGVSPMVRSWLHCVASEAESRAGNGVTACHDTDLAAKAMESDTPRPDWLDFYSPARQNAFAGYAALSAGDGSDAVTSLAAALDGLTEQDGKQRTVVLSDLASAHQDDVERAADYLNQAIDALSADWYRTGFDRIRAGRSMLRDSPDGTRLDQRLDALSAGAGYRIQM